MINARGDVAQKKKKPDFKFCFSAAGSAVDSWGTTTPATAQGRGVEGVYVIFRPACGQREELDEAGPKGRESG
jgi:hypothetical protein